MIIKNMENLLEETLKILEDNNLLREDIEWIGSGDCYFTLDEFIKVANKADYDSGYGGNEVAGDLLVVGKDWWLERGEYDGSEWWSLKRLPIKPVKKIRLVALTTHQSESAGIEEYSFGYRLLDMNVKKKVL